MTRALTFLAATFALLLGAAQAQRPRIQGVSHIAVYSADPVSTERFYLHDLGALRGPDPENPRGVRYYFNSLQFVEVLPLPAGWTSKSRLDHVAFQTADAEALRLYLSRHGQQVPAKLSVSSDGSPSFQVLDPEGNRVEFVQPVPGPAAAAHDAISRHIIHAGYIIHSLESEQTFYQGLLGFRPYWHGGPTEDRSDWFSLQVPDGQDWMELMRVDGPETTGVPAAMTAQVAGILNHFALGVLNMEQTVDVLYAGGRLGPRSSDPKIGRDGKWQINLYDPDGTRAEIMEFQPAVKPCCSPYLLPSPTGAEP